MHSVTNAGQRGEVVKRLRLSAMMGLQFMALGTWYPVLPEQLGRNGFSGAQIGIIYSLMPLACILTPFIVGQAADRYWPTERMLAYLHLASGLALFRMSYCSSYRSFLAGMFLWSLAFAPTFTLGNSITFAHLPEAASRFSLVRVFGTIGWILAGGVLTGVRLLRASSGEALFGGSDCLLIGALLSLILGIFCFYLPQTPPLRSGQSPWAVLSALSLLRRPDFAIFMGIVFVVSTEQMFHYVLTAPFLEAVGLDTSVIPATMTVAQVAEVGVMLGLPWLLKKLGTSGTLLVGVLAWPLRYGIFAVGQPRWLVISSLMLHSVCYVCFLVVSFIHVDSMATDDCRASAQALVTFVSLGVGMYIGSIFAGLIRDRFTNSTTQATDYHSVFWVPTVITAFCSVIFAFVLISRRRANGIASA